ncbi:MAG: hypothetical protein QOG12_1648 [Verrucomicrobiota bacterium]|jgi:hypothetical protein
MFVLRDKLADQKGGARRAVALAKARFFTEPKKASTAKYGCSVFKTFLIGSKHVDRKTLEFRPLSFVRTKERS